MLRVSDLRLLEPFLSVQYRWAALLYRHLHTHNIPNNHIYSSIALYRLQSFNRMCLCLRQCFWLILTSPPCVPVMPPPAPSLLPPPRAPWPRPPPPSKWLWTAPSPEPWTSPSKYISMRICAYIEKQKSSAKGWCVAVWLESAKKKCLHEMQVECFCALFSY